jgi:hypothetical protein
LGAFSARKRTTGRWLAAGRCTRGQVCYSAPSFAVSIGMSDVDKAGLRQRASAALICGRPASAAAKKGVRPSGLPSGLNSEACVVGRARASLWVIFSIPTIIWWIPQRIYSSLWFSSSSSTHLLDRRADTSEVGHDVEVPLGRQAPGVRAKPNAVKG